MLAPLADLGEFTALWLEGRIASQPGYANAEASRPDVAADRRAGPTQPRRNGHKAASSLGASGMGR